MKPITSARINSTASIEINGVDQGSLLHAIIEQFKQVDFENPAELAGLGLLQSEIERWLKTGEEEIGLLRSEIEERTLALSKANGKILRLETEIAALKAPPIPDWSAWRTSLMMDNSYLMYATQQRSSPMNAQVLSMLQHAIAMEKPDEVLVAQVWNKLNALSPVQNVPLKIWNDRCAEHKIPIRWDIKTGVAQVLTEVKSVQQFNSLMF